ncbi:hypothetical protein FV218_12305 [Methylobacterium sp. WL69]|uniref:hypothetical protein n=1 Tax=Methylobacterium sp. WL69 TaxID=2603893 RepID=UPI0011CBDB0B|nr:hypothetical protein [Methylobacterium sp. WL69]TXM72914.1 hypothetical protein FV218_12305 [Methylobacterium sp. WL69]
MSNFSSPSGWRDRLKRSKEKQVARDDMADIRAQRAKLAEDARAEGEKQARATEAALKTSRCACPVCDSGYVTVEVAERIYRALARLPYDSKPDLAVIEALVAAANGTAAPGTARYPVIPAGAKGLRRIDLDEAETAPASKPKLRATTEGRDGSLIDV